MSHTHRCVHVGGRRAAKVQCGHRYFAFISTTRECHWGGCFYLPAAKSNGFEIGKDEIIVLLRPGVYFKLMQAGSPQEAKTNRIALGICIFTKFNWCQLTIHLSHSIGKKHAAAQRCTRQRSARCLRFSFLFLFWHLSLYSPLHRWSEWLASTVHCACLHSHTLYIDCTRAGRDCTADTIWIAMPLSRANAFAAIIVHGEIPVRVAVFKKLLFASHEHFPPRHYLNMSTFEQILPPVGCDVFLGDAA